MHNRQQLSHDDAAALQAEAAAVAEEKVVPDIKCYNFEVREAGQHVHGSSSEQGGGFDKVLGR